MVLLTTGRESEEDFKILQLSTKQTRGNERDTVPAMTKKGTLGQELKVTLPNEKLYPELKFIGFTYTSKDVIQV